MKLTNFCFGIEELKKLKLDDSVKRIEFVTRFNEYILYKNYILFFYNSLIETRLNSILPLFFKPSSNSDETFENADAGVSTPYGIFDFVFSFNKRSAQVNTLAGVVT